MKTANQLEGMLSKLLVVQERYPKLKADRSFQNIMKSIGWVERELVRERNEIIRQAAEQALSELKTKEEQLSF